MFEESEVKMKVRKWFGHNWESLPIIIGLILLAVAVFKNPVGFQNLAWYGLVALTAVYAWATVRIARENKRTIEEMKQPRLDSWRPWRDSNPQPPAQKAATILDIISE